MWRIVVGICALIALVCGCGKKGPPELSLDQVPEAIKGVFASSRQALRTNADGIARLVAEKQYVAASLQLQALAGNSDLSDQQRSVIAGATIAVNSKLQELAATAETRAAGAGPVPTSAPTPAAKEEAAAAAAVLEHHIRTK